MTQTSIDIRCYCHGLGDCMLLRFTKEDGSPFWMLIDCGIHSAAANGGNIMRTVVDNIAELVGRRIDVVVGTHEHIDHNSAFLQAKAKFKGLDVGEVWFSWAENPADPDARKLDRFKADAASALAGSALHLSASKDRLETAKVIDGLLGFVFGVKGERVREARETLRGLSSTVRHFEPGTRTALPGVPGVRVYVLGPPRDPKLLGIENILSETYALGASTAGIAPLANALRIHDATLRVDQDLSAPFDGHEGLVLEPLLAGKWPADGKIAHFFWDHYLGPDKSSSEALCQQWRRIDNDWLGSAVDLALQLDGRTNNTSLVLAFELVDSGKVLLFAADAQIGNWMSWDQVTFDAGADGPATTVDALLRRTVFYKVGHHGSGNATRKVALEKMDRTNLVAFSPTDESLASRIGWKEFPAPNTNERIAELTAGRFIRSDAAWIKDPNTPVPIRPSGALKRIERDPQGLFVDITIG